MSSSENSHEQNNQPDAQAAHDQAARAQAAHAQAAHAQAAHAQAAHAQAAKSTRLPDGRPPRRSGDGWTRGSDGQKHWGLNGAAGLMLVDPERGVLLQHRALWSVAGGTWGFPGGARDLGESAIDAAIRESWEEAGVPERDGSGIEILATHVLDLDTWSYTTVIARTLRRFEPVISDPESIELSWVPVEQLRSYPLHPGVASALPELLERLNQHGSGRN